MLLFTELEQAAYQAPSEFWKKELIQAAGGKFPENFSYSDGTLFYNDGNRSSAVPLSGNAKEAASQFVNFCQKHGYDEASETISFVVRAKESAGNSWASIRKSIHRLKMMDSFVKNTASRYSLSKSETQQLRNTITMGLRTRKINKDNIVVKNYAVVEIKGLGFDSQLRKFTVSSEYVPAIKKAKPKPQPPPALNYSQEWLTYLKNNAQEYERHILAQNSQYDIAYIGTVNGFAPNSNNRSNYTEFSSCPSSS
jgi:hypothetical protein